MNILFTVAFLDGYHGSVIHVFEWARFFVMRGDKVEVATIFYTEEIRDFFLRASINVKLVDEKITGEYDIIFAYHYPTIGLLLGRGVICKKLVLGSLSSLESLESFPLNWDKASLLVVVSQEALQVHSSLYGIPKNRMLVIENCVPDEFFSYKCHQIPSGSQPRRIAVISNHAPEEIRNLKQFLNSVCEVDLIGLGGDKVVKVSPEFLAQYDMVISIGKTVQYALAMGIPVYEYDHFGGNGYITLEKFEREKNLTFRVVQKKENCP